MIGVYHIKYMKLFGRAATRADHVFRWKPGSKVVIARSSSRTKEDASSLLHNKFHETITLMSIINDLNNGCSQWVIDNNHYIPCISH